MSPNDQALAGTLAVVTGSLGKLGPHWVAALAEAGARVAGIDASAAGVEELEARLPDGSYEHHVADVTDRAALEEVRARTGAPSVLVCSAGIDAPPRADGSGVPIDAIPSDEFRRVVDVNLVGTFHAIQVFGTAMAEGDGGAIVTIGSLYASMAPDPRLYDHLPVDPPFLKPPAYGASKAAVLNLTRYFARLWGPRGVRANMLSPGGVSGGQDPEFVSKFSARAALGRMAEAEDLTEPLVFLASDASRYVTGQELRVDGGVFL